MLKLGIAISENPHAKWGNLGDIWDREGWEKGL